MMNNDFTLRKEQGLIEVLHHHQCVVVVGTVVDGGVQGNSIHVQFLQGMVQDIRKDFTCMMTKRSLSKIKDFPTLRLAVVDPCLQLLRRRGWRGWSIVFIGVVACIMTVVVVFVVFVCEKISSIVPMKWLICGSGQRVGSRVSKMGKSAKCSGLSTCKKGQAVDKPIWWRKALTSDQGPSVKAAPKITPKMRWLRMLMRRPQSWTRLVAASKECSAVGRVKPWVNKRVAFWQLEPPSSVATPAWHCGAQTRHRLQGQSVGIVGSFRGNFPGRRFWSAI